MFDNLEQKLLAEAEKLVAQSAIKIDIGKRDAVEKPTNYFRPGGVQQVPNEAIHPASDGITLPSPARSGISRLKVPRNRMLRPTLWTDEKFAECSPNARLMFVLCISQADDAGILCLQPKMLHGLLWFGIVEPPPISTTEALLKELLDQHFLIPYEVDNIRYGFLPNWFSHQKIDHPSLTQNPPPDLPIGEYSPNVQRMIAEWSAKAHPLFGERSPKTLSNIKEKKVKEVKVKETNTYSSQIQKTEFDDDSIFLTSFLISKIKFNDPKAKTPPMVNEIENGNKEAALANSNFCKWASEIEKLRRIDLRETKQIETVIIWCQDDGFWKSNILSAKTLRKQFPKLLLQMQRDDWREPKETDDARHLRLTGGG